MNVVVWDFNGHGDFVLVCVQKSRINVEVLYLLHFSHSVVYAQTDYALFSFTKNIGILSLNQLHGTDILIGTN
jgi:hypothetical protein